MLVTTTSLSIGDSQLTLIGRSRAGDGTCFVIPELKWMLDCGAPIVGWKPTEILLTHTHSDHVHYLTQYYETNNDNNNNTKKKKSQPINVYLPTKAVPLVERFLQSYQAMTECCCEDSSTQQQEDNVSLKLQGTDPNQEFNIGRKGLYYIQTVECEHRIDCLGYSIMKRKQILKDEYQDLPGIEIGKLRKQGIQVTQQCEEPVLLFLGDTTHVVFERYPNLLSQHKFVIVECSFLHSADRDRATKTKHMHWEDLKPYILLERDTLFVLTHFSLKYSALTIRQFFLEYKNVHPMILQSEVESEWKKLQQKQPAENNSIVETNAKDAAAPKCNCFQCCPPLHLSAL